VYSGRSGSGGERALAPTEHDHHREDPLAIVRSLWKSFLETLLDPLQGVPAIERRLSDPALSLAAEAAAGAALDEEVLL